MDSFFIRQLFILVRILSCIKNPNNINDFITFSVGYFIISFHKLTVFIFQMNKIFIYRTYTCKVYISIFKYFYPLKNSRDDFFGFTFAIKLVIKPLYFLHIL